MEFLKALNDRKTNLLKSVERIGSSSNTPISNDLKGLVIEDTPSGKINVLNETDNESDNSSISNSCQETNSLISLKDLNINKSNDEINKIVWKEPQKLYYQRASPPDILFEENNNNYQSKYSA